MLMLNDIAGALNKIANSKRDRTMLMLNPTSDFILNNSSNKRDRTMLMLNRSKINILFLHYSLYIFIFQSLIEILPADFSFMPIFFDA